MHKSAMNHARLFFETYVTADNLNIVEVGSQDVQGSIRSLKPATATYTGYDYVAGPGVDHVVSHPFTLPIQDNTVDVVISSSCYEHSGMFWMNFLEAMRVLKPSGVYYMQAPSNGEFHRWPIDSWRFYPDAGHSLAQWGKMAGHKNCELLESFIGNKDDDIWNDFVSVFIKDSDNANLYPNRILDKITAYTNGIKTGHTEFLNLDHWKNK
jgi:SAM-dependent methyltransferase